MTRPKTPMLPLCAAALISSAALVPLLSNAQTTTPDSQVGAESSSCASVSGYPDRTENKGAAASCYASSSTESSLSDAMSSSLSSSFSRSSDMTGSASSSM